MQLNLFDSKNVRQNDFHKHLKEFKLALALKDLFSLNHTFDPPKNLRQKIQAIEWINDSLALPEQELLIHLAWIRKEYNTIDYLEALKNDFPALIKGINKRMYELLDKSAFDFIYENLHPAEIFILQNDFKNGLKSLETFFKTYGENAFLRELHGFALWKTNRRNESFYDFTFALFDDATQCALDYLSPKTYCGKFKYYRTKFSEEKMAWARLPFGLWQDGQTYIDPKNRKFEAHIEEKIEHFAKNPKDSILILKQFNALLYLAEVKRLRQAPNPPDAIYFELQEKMKALNLEFFGLYYETLKAFGNIH